MTTGKRNKEYDQTKWLYFAHNAILNIKQA